MFYVFGVPNGVFGVPISVFGVPIGVFHVPAGGAGAGEGDDVYRCSLLMRE